MRENDFTLVTQLKDIGFVESIKYHSQHSSYWVYNEWIIIIHHYTVDFGYENRYSVYKCQKIMSLERINKMDFIDILKENFKLEIRNQKLNEIGI
jgi:hypothetical protein